MPRSTPRVPTPIRSTLCRRLATLRSVCSRSCSDPGRAAKSWRSQRRVGALAHEVRAADGELAAAVLCDRLVLVVDVRQTNVVVLGHRDDGADHPAGLVRVAAAIREHTRAVRARRRVLGAVCAVELHMLVVASQLDHAKVVPGAEHVDVDLDIGVVHDGVLVVQRHRQRALHVVRLDHPQADITRVVSTFLADQAVGVGQDRVQALHVRRDVGDRVVATGRNGSAANPCCRHRRN